MLISRSADFRIHVFLSLFFLMFFTPHVARAITVTNTNDSGTGSLRQVIAAAVSGDTVNFDLPPGSVITLTTQLSIGKNLTINGPGADTLTVNQTGLDQRVFFFSSPATLITVNGLKMTGGNVDTDGGGGGCCIMRVELKLNNCVVTGNDALIGGGIYLYAGSLVAVNTTISSNEATSQSGGGGINVREGSLVLDNVSIVDNTCIVAGATGQGGGLVIRGDDPIIRNSTISGNHCDGYGGGIYWYNSNADQSLELTDCTISDNTSTDYFGGGVSVSGGGLKMTRCKVKNNHAYQAGGGLYVSGSNNPVGIFLTDCVFEGNTTSTSNGAGGYLYGPETLNYVSINSCLFLNNAAGNRGGGLYLYRYMAVIRNSTFHGNTADGTGGGGIAVKGSSPQQTQVRMSFVTITGNTGDYDCTTSNGTSCGSDPGGGIYVEDNTDAPEILLKSCVVAENRDSKYSFKVQTYADLSAGNFISNGYNFIGRKGSAATGLSNGVNNDQVGGIMPIDPKLKDLDNYGGFTPSREPRSGSPLIDAGGTATDTNAVPLMTDQRGMKRPMGPAADIGAVECGTGNLSPIFNLLLFE